MAFIVSSPGSLSSTSNSGVVSGTNAAGFVSTAANFAARRYAPVLIGAAVKRMDRAVTRVASSISGSDFPSRLDGNDSGNGGGSNNNGGGSGGGGKSVKPGGWRPSKRDKGIGGSPNVQGVPQFTIDTGIDSGTLINPLQPTTKYFTPLFIQCGEFMSTLDIQKDSTLANLLNVDLFYKYLVIVQSEVNFGLSRNFTQDNFYMYISTLSEAIQLYYMIDSILAYTSHTPNNNLAMTRLRMAITPEISNSHTKLREILESTPIPPRLLEYIRYMYQNYSFNNVEGSSIIRLSFKDSLCTSEYDGGLGINESTYFSIINRLIDLATVSSIINKIRPSWKTRMLPSSYEALYDPQFSTFWHNSNIAFEDYGSKVVKHTISVEHSYDMIYYGIFDNRLDGIIYASCSVTDQNGVIEKGMWKPFSEFDSRNSINSSLLHYSNDSYIRPVTEVEYRISSMVHAAPHTVITKDNNPVWELYKNHYAGSCVPQVHKIGRAHV